MIKRITDRKFHGSLNSIHKFFQGMYVGIGDGVLVGSGGTAGDGAGVLVKVGNSGWVGVNDGFGVWVMAGIGVEVGVLDGCALCVALGVHVGC